MNVAIVAHGHLEKELLPDIRSADFIIGVDRAAYWLISQGVVPHLAIGDFDSTSPRELASIKENVTDVRSFPSKKDETDFELAINHAISGKPKSVALYGAIGSRFDHTLAAVNVLEKFLEKHIEAKIRDNHNEVFFVQSRRTIISSSRYKYLSVLAHTPKAVVTIGDVLYPISEGAIYRNSSLGISNEIVGKQAEIIVHSGIVLVVQSRDSSK